MLLAFLYFLCLFNFDRNLPPYWNATFMLCRYMCYVDKFTSHGWSKKTVAHTRHKYSAGTVCYCGWSLNCWLCGLHATFYSKYITVNIYSTVSFFVCQKTIIQPLYGNAGMKCEHVMFSFNCCIQRVLNRNARNYYIYIILFSTSSNPLFVFCIWFSNYSCRDYR